MSNSIIEDEDWVINYNYDENLDGLRSEDSSMEMEEEEEAQTEQDKAEAEREGVEHGSKMKCIAAIV